MTLYHKAVLLSFKGFLERGVYHISFVAKDYDFDKLYTVTRDDGWNKRNWKIQNGDRCIPYLKSYSGKFFKLVILKGDFNYSGRKISAKGTVNEQKLECNLIRGKSRVFELSLCNDWDCFVTLTLDKEKYDRYNLKKYIKDLTQFIRNQKRIKGTDLKYLLVPEQHIDGAWHLHGFMKGIPQSDIVPTGHISKTGFRYLHWLPYFKKFGFMSFEPIRDSVASAFYIRKYISKTMLDNSMELGIHSYYASQGLKGADELQDISKFNLNDYDYCYESNFVDVANLSIEQARELLTKNQDCEVEI